MYGNGLMWLVDVPDVQ